MNELIHTF